jgi:hypothetical protein
MVRLDGQQSSRPDSDEWWQINNYHDYRHNLDDKSSE